MIVRGGAFLATSSLPLAPINKNTQTHTHIGDFNALLKMSMLNLRQLNEGRLSTFIKGET